MKSLNPEYKRLTIGQCRRLRTGDAIFVPVSWYDSNMPMEQGVVVETDPVVASFLGEHRTVERPPFMRVAEVAAIASRELPKKKKRRTETETENAGPIPEVVPVPEVSLVAVQKRTNCRLKRRYDTPEQAEVAAAATTRNNLRKVRKVGRTGCRAYQCQVCTKWHVTSLEATAYQETTVSPAQ